MKTLTTLAAAAVLTILAGCGDAETAPVKVETGPAKADPSDALPADLFLKAKPGEAVAVAALKRTAKEGDAVVIRGRIGGTGAPFVPGRAVFTVADPVLVPCSEMAMPDSCPTPWDYCCEDRAVLTAHTATVEVDGPDGRPLRADLKGMGGVAELKTVTVVGVVGPRPDPAVLVVRATGIFVE